MRMHNLTRFEFHVFPTKIEFETRHTPSLLRSEVIPFFCISLIFFLHTDEGKAIKKKEGEIMGSGRLRKPRTKR